ncbi:type VI secretion system tube protein Hcp [Verrucomicrobiaceae bacterium 227]
MFALSPLGLDANINGYLKIDDIPGESTRADHEDEIDVHGIQWKIEADASSAGSGRVRGKAVVGPLKIAKFVDASSPYLALASMQGKSLPEIILAVRGADGAASLDYLTITLTNVRVDSYEIKTTEGDAKPSEEVSFSFERIKYKYVVQEDDHSAGDEHEIEYDIAAGA